MIRRLVLAWILLASSATAVWAAAPEVLGVRAGRQVEDVTRFVLDISQKVDYHIFTLPDPYRVVIDFPDMEWKINREALDRLVRDNPAIKGFRFGQFGQGGGRIVMEVNQPLSVKNSFILNPIGPHPFRFVVDLAKTDAASFLRESEASKQAAAKPDPVMAKVPPPPLTVPHAKKDTRKIVVIDPGHGGVDPGAISVNGYYEKNLTLAISKELARQLNATGRYKAVLTRNDDDFMALRERVTFARAAGADLFISIHADSHGEWETRGASVYTLSSEASDKEAAALATKENKADIIAGLDLTRQDRDVASILIDLAQRETMNRSKVYAGLLVEEFERAKVTLLPARPHRSAGFAVLTAPDVPAVLLEVGYLSNRTDERALMQQSHRQKLARAIIKAADSFFAPTQPVVAKVPAAQSN
ncbi:MAG: N-acetylmuramoyl-L-alanine amidase [Reyranellaceae bacterium]